MSLKVKMTLYMPKSILVRTWALYRLLLKARVITSILIVMYEKRTISDNVRKICYERDNESCQWPECELSRKNGDVVNLHHVLPEQFGGKETPDNLITLCDIHHKNKHIEFHASYSDSQGILDKMNKLIKNTLSRIRRTLGVDDGNDLSQYLVFLTGNNKFRSGQLKAIRIALAGDDVLFVTPTGAGKSACYQLPGLLGNEPSMVVSPLKALMKDQVESLWSKLIPTTYINSDLTSDEKKKRYGFIRQGLYKFIFVAPERFKSKDPQTEYLYRKYQYLVIDEAHAIEMWGMAFRPSYRKLGELRKKLENPQIIALTATASKETQLHILDSLNMKDAEVIVTGFYRDNIKINIHKVGVVNKDGYLNIGKYEYIRNVISENPLQKILIFSLTVKAGEELLSYLHDNDVECELFHSNLETKSKMQIQNRFTGTEQPGLNVLISTSAFGMGIDIPNIRHVIHLSPALSVTDYTQQIGRAGRDGWQSYAHLLYHQNDEGLLRFMAQLPLKTSNFKEKHEYSDDDVEKVKMKLDKQVDDILEFIDQPKGREWQYILDYFGEAKPSFWDQWGKLVVDSIIVLVLTFTTISMINIFYLLVFYNNQ